MLFQSAIANTSTPQSLNAFFKSKVSLAGQILAHLKAHTRVIKLHKTLQTALSRAMRRHVCVLSKNGEAGHEYLEQTVSLNTRKVNVGVYV